MTGAESGANVTATLTAFHRANQSNATAAPFVFDAAWTLSRLAKSAGDSALYRTWLANAMKARQTWEKRLDPDDKAALDAAAPRFAALDRELAPTHVTATTSLAAVFAGTSLEVLPLAP